MGHSRVIRCGNWPLLSVALPNSCDRQQRQQSGRCSLVLSRKDKGARSIGGRESTVQFKEPKAADHSLFGKQTDWRGNTRNGRLTVMPTRSYHFEHSLTTIASVRALHTLVLPYDQAKKLIKVVSFSFSCFSSSSFFSLSFLPLLIPLLFIDPSFLPRLPQQQHHCYS